MNAVTVDLFWSFLKKQINNDVVIINTNLGMEIYYYASSNYNTLIKESSLLYLIKEIDSSKIRYRFHENREEVFQSFCESLFTFLKYPRIFLAYTKKFLSLVKEHERQNQIITILKSFFEEALTILEETERIPFHDKIKQLNKKSQQPEIDNKIIQELISEILTNEHKN